ncbi:MAG TPA: DNA topoisomerase IB [Polyangiaceae bacterium]|nr:DNA topoisomerase IB [Polyangiaceae bacterium]
MTKAPTSPPTAQRPRRTQRRPVADFEQLLRDGSKAARAAHLEYARLDAPGFGRKRRGKSFAYHDERGRAIRSSSVVARIRKLAIPPAWTQVWICPSPLGHVQATGRDAKGRKQYRYHERFRALRDGAKYLHILRFGYKLPELRRTLARDLRRPGLEQSKVLSAVIELMQRTCMRVGNDRYAEQNGSYGLTTLRDRHAKIRGSELEFHFKGKSGKVHHVRLDDARLARIVRSCRDVPGQRLFQYEGNDGRFHAVTSGDVNDYLRRVTGEPFSAKDFRTWSGTLLAVHALAASEPCTSISAKRRAVKQALEGVSAELGNTIAICRKSYVHPAVIDQYTSGELVATFRKALQSARRRPVRGLRQPESVALRWLEALPALPARL